MKHGILRVVEGDVTNPQRTAPNDIVVIPHCCNNKGVMGAGVALALRKKWGKVYKVYKEMEAQSPSGLKNRLGDICYAKVKYIPNTTKATIVVINMIGQDGVVSADNLKHVKYLALSSAMKKVFYYVELIKSQTSKPVVIHCPKFGSDLAGGNFEFILELIREIWIENGIDVVVYEFVAPNMRDRKKKDLWRTDITIWTDEDPYKSYPSVETLVRESISGAAYSDGRHATFVEDIYLNAPDGLFDGLDNFFFDPREDDEFETF